MKGHGNAGKGQTQSSNTGTIKTHEAANKGQQGLAWFLLLVCPTDAAAWIVKRYDQIQINLPTMWSSRCNVASVELMTAVWLTHP